MCDCLKKKFGKRAPRQQAISTLTHSLAGYLKGRGCSLKLTNFAKTQPAANDRRLTIWRNLARQLDELGLAPFYFGPENQSWFIAPIDQSNSSVCRQAIGD